MAKHFCFKQKKMTADEIYIVLVAAAALFKTRRLRQ